jgi:hypothetical protein
VRSPSTSINDSERPWLEEQVYAPKRQRTIDLVQQSIDELRQTRKRISLASVARQSRQLDPQGIGVSESAVLGNAEARAYYERYRTWSEPRRQYHRDSPTSPAPAATLLPTKATRDESRVRQRYMRLGKAELVDRLLRVEQAYAEQEERWLQVNDELLLLRLRISHSQT